jgi:hypothetical protein
MAQPFYQQIATMPTIIGDGPVILPANYHNANHQRGTAQFTSKLLLPHRGMAQSFYFTSKLPRCQPSLGDGPVILLANYHNANHHKGGV